jgi:hypothetical protein
MPLEVEIVSHGGTPLDRLYRDAQGVCTRA